MMLQCSEEHPYVSRLREQRQPLQPEPLSVDLGTPVAPWPTAGLHIDLCVSSMPVWPSAGAAVAL